MHIKLPVGAAESPRMKALSNRIGAVDRRRPDRPRDLDGVMSASAIGIAGRRRRALAGAVEWLLAAGPAEAQMTEPILADIEYLARQMAVCYADGRMEFGQRVLHRRFVHDYLTGCRASARQVRRIDDAFLHRPAGSESCNLTRFFEIKGQLQRARDRHGC